MEGMINIENLTGKHLQFRIGHQEVCVKVGRCMCRQGRRSVEAMTIHIQGHGKTAFLPAAVAQSAEIRAAANGNKPTIKIHGHKAKTKAKAASSAVTSNEKAEGRKASTGRKGQEKKAKATT